MVNSIRPILLLLLVWLLLPVTSYSDPTRIVSSQGKQTQLLELYTSQGCSSCPPADRWLSQWQHNPELWNKLVPVAFHVDYWDWIGWQDPYASPRHGQRQRAYKQSGGIKSVYTPGFVVDGHEWRGWFSGAALPAASTKKGELIAHINADSIRLEYRAASLPDNVSLHIALLGFDLQTAVKAGENSSRKLHEDFVVLLHKVTNGHHSGKLELPPKDTLPTNRLGFAAWISSPGSNQPLQVVGGMF